MLRDEYKWYKWYKLEEICAELRAENARLKARLGLESAPERYIAVFEQDEDEKDYSYGIGSGVAFESFSADSLEEARSIAKGLWKSKSFVSEDDEPDVRIVKVLLCELVEECPAYDWLAAVEEIRLRCDDRDGGIDFSKKLQKWASYGWGDEGETGL